MKDLKPIDIIGPEVVEIKIRRDHQVVWVNVDGYLSIPRRVYQKPDYRERYSKSTAC